MRRRDQGTSTVELAMYTPVLFFVIFLTVQAALLFLGNQAASAAAREAARVARSGGGTSAAMIAGRQRGAEYAHTVGHGVLDNPVVEMSFQADRQIQATVHGDAIRLLPGIPMPDISGTAQGPIEEFRPDPGVGP